MGVSNADNSFRDEPNCVRYLREKRGEYEISFQWIEERYNDIESRYDLKACVFIGGEMVDAMWSYGFKNPNVTAESQLEEEVLKKCVETSAEALVQVDEQITKLKAYANRLVVQSAVLSSAVKALNP